MPTNVEKRLGKSISKAASVCEAARVEVSAAASRLSDVYDAIDAVVGGAHANATKTEVEAMMVALDDAVTETEVVSRDLIAATAKLREVRGRLDRSLTAYNAERRSMPMVPSESPGPGPTIGGEDAASVRTAEFRERQAGSEPQA